ncbi:MAG: TonB-dependent receptor [Deltaproteobacteria bacterium]|nr:MAG: TonB-dependent receptor [Deltaproteobacteria bacterium]
MTHRRKPTRVFSILRMAVYVLYVITMVTGANAQTSSANEGTEIDYLKGLSIEDLLQTEIISASKKSELLFDTASAIFVITQEDLRRTGARNIPEALRMVPGLQVAHINAHRWAISSRGFADWFSNKLLVLIDGRSVYNPIFSGVHWDVQETIMADIERIEVIRGPGATVWGANAVNGVINIITKNASKTLGALFNMGVGTHEQPLVAARYGTRIADMADIRLFAKGFKREPFNKKNGGEAHDAWRHLQGGFRVDWQAGRRDDFMFDGRFYDGEANSKTVFSGFLTPPYTRITKETETFSGGHLLSRWIRRLSDSSDLTLQAYYDTTRRDLVALAEDRYTIDVEIKYHLDPDGRHDVVCGAGYRWNHDEITGTPESRIEPDSRSDDLVSAFVQDDIMLLADRLWLTLGSKFEYNGYTGFEIQPSARTRFKLKDKHMFWAAVSRAVRTPSRSENGVRSNQGTIVLPTGDLVIARVVGDENFDSEVLIAYEAGYRWQPQPRFSMALTAFFNDYDQLRNASPAPFFWERDPAPVHLVIPFVMDNSLKGETSGVEALMTWRPLDVWRFSASYALLEFDLQKTGNSVYGTLRMEQGKTPDHQLQLRSYLDLPWNFHFDAELYFVDRLPSLDIDAYTRVDLRLEWTPSPQWTLSVGVENLLDDSHQEYLDGIGIIATKVPRIGYGQVTLNF